MTAPSAHTALSSPSPAATLLWLALALAAPLAFAALLRSRALRAAASDPDAAWFGCARLSQWAVVAAWILWWTALSATNALHGVVRLLAPIGLPVAAAALGIAYVVPAALVVLLIQATVHDVRRRAGATRLTTREALRAAAWQMAAALVPATLVVTGGAALFARSAGLGCALMIAALLARIILLRSAMDATGVVPQSITTGELRDRIFELAARARVRLKQIYVLPMARQAGANAFAVSNGTVMLTDVLLTRFSRAEVIAIMAHEVAHLRHQHPQRIARTAIFSVLAPVMVAEALSIVRVIPIYAAVGLAAVASLILTQWIRRKFEYEADATATTLCGDPVAQITSLARLSMLNHVPLHWGRWAEHSLTHPSTRRRLERIAGRAGIGPEELRRLVVEMPSVGGHFEVPGALDSARVVTTTWKLRVSSNNAMVLLAVQALVPAFAIRWLPVLGLEQRPGLLLAATLATLGAVLATAEWLMVAPSRGLEKRLARRLRESGAPIDPGAAFYVGLSPGEEPRIYENSADWDLGFVTLDGERLCYHGEETRFALERGRITDLRLADGLPHWIPARRVLVEWRDAEGGPHAFTLRPARVPGLSFIGPQSRRLLERLRAWRAGEALTTIAPSARDSAASPLGDPPVAPVTSISIRELTRPALVMKYTFVVAFLAAATGAGLGLPGPFERAGFVDAMLASVLAALIQRLPAWAARRRRSVGAPRVALERAA